MSVALSPRVPREGVQLDLPNSEVAVRIRGVCKAFRIQKGWTDLVRRPFRHETRVALHDIQLEVARGEFFGLLGQNGAGKSTLFRILAGLVQPDAGRVQIEDIDVVAQPARSRAMLAPVIPSERSLYWRLSAHENLRLFGTLYGLNGAQLRQRMEEVLAVVGLAGAGRKQVGLFSTGMKQRLLIARALLPRPRILLLDEPTRSLDPVSAREFRRFLREDVGARQGCTVLLATHDHQEVRELCDRIGILHRGRLLAGGPTDVVLGTLDFQRIRIRLAADLPALIESRLEMAGARILEMTPADATGWRWLRLQLPSTDEPEALLTELVAQGVRVSRIEREELTLADLLETVARHDVPTEAP